MSSGTIRNKVSVVSGEGFAPPLLRDLNTGDVFQLMREGSYYIRTNSERGNELSYVSLNSGAVYSAPGHRAVLPIAKGAKVVIVVGLEA